MKENVMATVILVAALLIVVNGLFFAFVKNIDWTVTMVCIFYCNIAVLAMFLPLLTNTGKREKAQRLSMYLLSSIYLLVEIISMFIIMNVENMSGTMAFISQGIIFALFLLIYFSISSADSKSDRDIELKKASSSLILKKGISKIRLQLDCTDDRSRRALLQEALAMMSSMSNSKFMGSDEIDCAIYDICSDLCADICKENVRKLRDSISRRRSEMIACQ